MSRHRHRLVLAVLCCPALLTLPVRGQTGTAAPITIPTTIKSSATPDRSAIASFIDGQVKNLAGDSTDPKAAREALIEQSGGTAATPQFQAEYAAALAKALLPLLGEKNSLRSRLNAAIVAGSVAAKVQKAGQADPLAPLIEAMLKDKEAPIAIWGMKGARYVLASIAQNNGNTASLNTLIVNTVKGHAQGPEAGALVEDAYLALTLEPVRSDPNLKTMAPKVLPGLTDLIQWRAAQYLANGTPPPNVLAERPIVGFLSVDAFPAVIANVNTRDRVFSATANLTCSVVNLIGGGNADQDLIETTRLLGKALEAFGSQMQPPAVPLQTAGQTVAQVTATTNPAQLTAACNSIKAALQEIGVSIDSQTPPPGPQSATVPNNQLTPRNLGAAQPFLGSPAPAR